MCCFHIRSFLHFVTGFVLSVCAGEMLCQAEVLSQLRSPYSLGGNERLGETHARPQAWAVLLRPAGGPWGQHCELSLPSPMKPGHRLVREASED